MEKPDQNITSPKIENLPYNYLILSSVIILLSISFFIFYIYNYNYILSISLLLFVILVFISLVNLKYVWFLILFLTPFSLEIYFSQFSFAIQFPTEIIIPVVILIWGLKYFLKGNTTYKSFAFNTPLLIFLLFCMLSLIKSEYMLYSIKGLIILFGYIIIGYYFPLHNFASKKDIKSIVFLLIFLSVIFSLIGIYKHFFTETNFIHLGAKGVPRPFFTEHGSYAAFITFGFALSLYLGFYSRNMPNIWILRLSAVIIFTGIILSYTRAAWIGTLLLLFITFGFSILKKFSIKKLFTLFLVLLIFSLIVYIFALHTTVGKHYLTIYNIRNLSNLERFNRWMAAIKMFQQSPLIGVGFDTYINNYYHYRSLNFTTALSSAFMGVHSEYLKVLAETGLFGFIAFIYLLIRFFRIGFTLWKRIEDSFLKLTVLGIMGGLFSYLIQAIFNNFIKYDKVAIPFWLSFGLIGAIGSIIQEKKNHASGN